MNLYVKRRTENDLRCYKAYKKELEYLLEDTAMESVTVNPNAGISKGGVSDPTYNAVNKYYDDDRYKRLNNICRSIDIYMFGLGRNSANEVSKRKIIEMFYFNKSHTIPEIADVLGYDERTIYRWKAEIIKEIAVCLGYFN